MKFVQFALYLLIAVAALFWGPAAYAQVTTSYISTVDAPIDGTTTCTAPLTRTFNVTDNFTISDVDIGVFIRHTYRGDLRMQLRSPAGTAVLIVNGSGAVSGDNFNVLLDDANTQVVNTDGNTTLHSATNPPPWDNDFAPNNALSAFNGENSLGTWSLDICDTFPGEDDGAFDFAQLFLTSIPPNFADVSVSKNVSNATPANGTAITYTVQVTNAAASTDTTTGVVVQDLLPPGVTYDSHTSPGTTYNQGTGVWTVGTLTPGQTRTLTIEATVNVTNGTTIINTAEVTASSFFDPDSTPGNGVAAEDDQDTASFTVTGTRAAGIAPTLFCPAGTNLFDWDTRAWPAGSLNEDFVMAGFGTVNIAISTDGTFLTDATFGGQTPALGGAATGGNTGGSAANGLSLHQLLDFDNIFQTATTVITLPNGIAGTQFTVFDVDFANNDFADKVTVTGSYQGATVMPTLTNGIANYVSGNVAIGDATAGNTSSDANVVVTFDQPIDTITIVYGNHTTAPAVPDGQAYTFHDFTFCAPSTSLSVLKTSAVFSDPVNNVTNPKAVPGALMEYNILVSNTGISDTDSDTVVITDNVPPETKFCLADLGGGGSGPIRFIDGASGSDLTYTFTGLGDAGDDLSFSNDNGATFTYSPTADADGCDTAITNFRVIPNGNFAGGSSFTLQARFIIE
ncbi:proprotein convertase P-domain-containing protein [Erythrobacter sp. W53]|uniref:proprotein convertase P-domain-containing protein n=1 Tax=Erythrobacter sp. W53 TaxID=3425947 RepID=UPI003D767968